MKKISGITFVVLSVIFLLPFAFLSGCSESETGLNHYEITAVYDHENRTLSASEKLSYINKTETTLDEICLHLYPNAFREGARFFATPKDKIEQAYPEGINYGNIAIEKVMLNGKTAEYSITGDDENILALKLPSELFPQERVEISIEFLLKIPLARHRFGQSDGITNLGNWYPIACAYSNGKFESEPYYELGDPFFSDCADYSVKITVPKPLVVAGSSDFTKRETDNMIEYDFKGKNLRDFAMCIGDMQVETASINGVKVSVYRAKSDEQNDKIMQTSLDAINTFSSLYGKYPYSTYSVVKTGFLYGGMEYAGLSMVSNALNQSLLTDAVVHETAHQWWYGVVGNNEIKHPWLDESLAEFSTGEFYRVNTFYGVDESKRLADALSSYVVYFDKTMPAPKSDIMSRNLAEYVDETEYAFCSYVKGQLMLRDLRSVIGAEKFNDALKKYYRDYAYKTATPDDLIGTFEDVSGRPLSSYFYSWIDGKAQSFA